MNLNRRVTGALAWAGLAIVVAVPTAEIVASRFGPTMADATVTTPSASPVAVAEVVAPAAEPEATVLVAGKPLQPEPEPAAAEVAPGAPDTDLAQADDSTTDDVSTDPVGDYLSANKGLPSYLTPAKGAAPQQAAAAPAPASSAPAETAAAPVQTAPGTASTQVASLPDAAAPVAITPPAEVVAPIPMPASARPRPQPVAVVDTIDTGAIGQPAQKPRAVTEADLKDWKSGTLEDYLKQHNLLSPSSTDAGN